MVPKKKIMANTRKPGTGSLSNAPGRDSMTPVDSMMSLNIMIQIVLVTIFDSTADKNIGFNSLKVNLFMNTDRTMEQATAAYTGIPAPIIRPIAKAMLHKLLQRLRISPLLSILGGIPVSFGIFLRQNRYPR